MGKTKGKRGGLDGGNAEICSSGTTTFALHGLTPVLKSKGNAWSAGVFKKGQKGGKKAKKSSGGGRKGRVLGTEGGEKRTGRPA